MVIDCQLTEIFDHIVCALQQPLACPPAMRYYHSTALGKILLRGDSEGAVKAWIVPEFPIEEIVSMKSRKDFKPERKLHYFIFSREQL